MKTAWPNVKLGELLLRSDEAVDPAPDTEYSEITVRMWGKGVVERGRISGSRLSGRRFIARDGQFIVSRIDARHGAMGLVPPALDGALVTNDFPLFSVNARRLEPAFFGWLFRTADFIELCKRASEGTTNRVRLKEERLLALEIPLPPLTEQRRIVARIEELAAQIHEASSLRYEASIEANLLWQRGSEGVFHRLAEQYPPRPLSELIQIRGGGTPSKADPSYWEGEIPWITPKDMKARELRDATDHISERATQESPAKLIEPGAVLVVVRGMILAHTFPAATLRAPAAINQDMKALVPNGEILPEFLCTMLWAHNPRIVEKVERSTHDTRKLETAKLLDTQIPVPPLADQRRVLAELDALQAEVDTLKRLQTETATELDAMLPAILDRAFNGEL